MARAQGAGTSMRGRVTAQAQACASVQCEPARTPRAAGRVRAPCPGTAHRIALSISSAVPAERAGEQAGGAGDRPTAARGLLRALTHVCGRSPDMPTKLAINGAGGRMGACPPSGPAAAPCVACTHLQPAHVCSTAGARRADCRSLCAAGRRLLALAHKDPEVELVQVRESAMVLRTRALHGRLRTSIRPRTCASMHANIHVHINLYTRTRKHAHIHACTHA